MARTRIQVYPDTANWKPCSPIRVIAGDPHKFNAVNKEYACSAKLAKPYIQFLDLTKAVASSEELAAAHDAEMRAMAEEELADLRPERDALHAKIEDQLLARSVGRLLEDHRGNSRR